MLTFINFTQAPEQIEIEADETGINDLIDSLNYVLKSKGHIHLTIDTELNEATISENRKSIIKTVKSVTIRYLDQK